MSNERFGQDGSTSRRSLIKSLGYSLGPLSIIGVGNVKAEKSQSGEGGLESAESKKPNKRSPVEPQWMTGATTKFSPYNISTYETSTLQSTWSFQAIPPKPGDYYQIDILVNAENVEQPETMSYNVGEDDITKDWQYTNSSPVGSAYHWQAKVIIADILGAKVSVDAEITPTDQGKVEAKTGTYWPWQSWSTGYLDID